MTRSEAENTAHEILDPIVARAKQAAFEFGDHNDFHYAEQLEGWVSDEINNSYQRGLSGERLARRVAAKFGLVL